METYIPNCCTNQNPFCLINRDNQWNHTEQQIYIIVVLWSFVRRLSRYSGYKSHLPKTPNYIQWM